MNYASFEDVKEIVTGMAKKVPQGIMESDTQVGHVTWQMYLMRDYLKLDGTALANASTDYNELLEFAQNNNLITSIVTDNTLFKYDSGTDVLTLPDYSTLATTLELIPQIKYTKSSTVWESIDVGRFVAMSPVYYERNDLPTPNKTTITIHRSWINVDNYGYVLENDKVIDLTNADSWDDSQYTTASNRAGKDFYIYACTPTSGVEPKFILSANSTIPTGYTANDSRKIGGFHCLCVSVGTISGHTLSGYVAGDILPLSVWDLNHRAVSENEGMAWIPQIGLWADIYLGSWNGSNLVSTYNGVPVTGTSSKAMHGLMFAEEYGLVNKRLPTYDDFIVCAKGTPEGSHISTDAAPTGAGGHIDKSGRRIISNYGLEDCCGVLWQWSSTLAENCLRSGGNATTYRGSSWNGSNYYLDNYELQDAPVYNSTVDTVKRGSSYGLLRRLFVGGNYGDAVAVCGSRAVDAFNFGALLGAFVGGRGFSEKR